MHVNHRIKEKLKEKAERMKKIVEKISKIMGSMVVKPHQIYDSIVSHKR